MNKKLKVLIKVMDNVVAEYHETKILIENNIKEVCQGESMTMEEIIYFVGFILYGRKMFFHS